VCRRNGDGRKQKRKRRGRRKRGAAEKGIRRGLGGDSLWKEGTKPIWNLI